MNLPFYIASRYLFSKKKQNVINIISLISVTGVALGTMALVIVLSAFNGLNEFVDQQYGNFDPDLKILPSKGKTFVPGSDFENIKAMDQVAFYAEVLEENALLKYGNRQRPAIVKGVDENFGLMKGIDSMMVDGHFVLNGSEHQFAVLGYAVALDLGIGLNFINPISFYAPKPNAKPGHNPMNAFNIEHLHPSGFFQIQVDFDTQYALVPLSFARKLFHYEKEITAVEITVKNPQKLDELKAKIKQILGAEFQVKDRFELHEFVYKMMKTEKIAIFFILAFILIIASFNITGSLIMLILDKKEDAKTLRSLGANEQSIKTLFLMEGCMISLLGAIIGVILGLVTCWMQIKYGFLKLSSNSFVTNTYPIDVRPLDILLIFITVALIGFFASRFPVRYITKRHLQFS